jgi:hypothetical protein
LVSWGDAQDPGDEAGVEDALSVADLYLGEIASKRETCGFDVFYRVFSSWNIDI